MTANVLLSSVDGIIDDRGDFVDSEDECDVEEVAENPIQYAVGVYYPVCVGDLLAKRYRVEHKLGHGGFSTVWMAHDTVKKEDVALKIIKPGQSGEYEYSIQNKIITAVGNTPLLLLYRNTFFLTSPHGQHRVLVFPVKGPNFREYACQTPFAARMSALRQLLQSLKCLHDAGFIHRDLNSGNAMYSLRSLNKGSTTAEKYGHVGRPQKMIMPEYRPLWKEAELVMPMRPHASIVGDTVCLGDFGLTIKAGTQVTSTAQAPVAFCAPELLHGESPTFASDMWSYFSIFAELYIGRPLVCGPGTAFIVDFIVDTFGPMPESWKGSYIAGGTPEQSWYDPQRQPRLAVSMEARLAKHRPDITVVERRHALRVLQRGFSYVPQRRFTASELLEDSSFKALMEIYGL